MILNYFESICQVLTDFNKF